MPHLPARFAGIILSFAPLFVHRSWRHAQALLIGAILCPGQRTVASVLRITGWARDRHFVNTHRVLSRAAWSPRTGARILLRLLVEAFAPRGPIVLALDDTIERRWGRRIPPAPALKSTNETHDEVSETTASDDPEEEVSFEGIEVSNVDDEGCTELSSNETEDELDFSDKKFPTLLYERLEEDDLKILGSSLKQAWLVFSITGQRCDHLDALVKLENITLEDPIGPHSKS